MSIASGVRTLARLIVTIVVVIPGGLIALLLMLWAISFIDLGGGPEKCAFNSVTEDEYRQLLVQAKAQRWTVWPDLSNGIFFPSIQSPKGYSVPGATYGPATDDKLLGFIRQLVPADSRSADRELAAAHALMRSIGAELVDISNIAPYNGRASISFTYFLPQRRFAPLCLLCFIFPDTTILVNFDRPVATGVVALAHVAVLHPKLDTHGTKAPKTAGPCPAFPPVRIGR